MKRRISKIIGTLERFFTALRSVQNDKKLFFFTKCWLNLIKLALMPDGGEGQGEGEVIFTE